MRIRPELALALHQMLLQVCILPEASVTELAPVVADVQVHRLEVPVPLPPFVFQPLANLAVRGVYFTSL